MGRTSVIHYAAAFALALSPVPAAAYDERYQMATGNDYFAVCTSPELDDKELCLTFTVGVTRGLITGEYASQLKSGQKIARTIFCIPASANNQQILDVILKFLRDRLDVRDVDTTSLIWRALFGAFPCTKL
jgi:hypothetical protein